MSRLETLLCRRLAIIGAVCCAFASAVAAQHAEAATIGSSFTNLPDASSRCPSASCAVVLEALDGSPVTAPFDGFIVGWRVRGNGMFAVAPVTYAGDDTVVRSPASANHTATSIKEISAFTTRIPISAGQHVELYLTKGSTVAIRSGVDGADADAWVKAIPPLGVPAKADAPDQHYDVGYDVDIEPDADHDGFIDGSEDACPTNPQTQGACPAPAPSPPDPFPPVFLRRPHVQTWVFGPRYRARITFALSEASRVTVAMRRRVRGRFRPAGEIVRNVPEGQTTIAIGRHSHSVQLRPGRYRVLVRAEDAAGNEALARTAFRVRRVVLSPSS